MRIIPHLNANQIHRYKRLLRSVFTVDDHDVVLGKNDKKFREIKSSDLE